MSRGVVQEAVVSYGGTPPQLIATVPVVTRGIPIEAVVRYVETPQVIFTEPPPTN